MISGGRYKVRQCRHFTSDKGQRFKNLFISGGRATKKKTDTMNTRISGVKVVSTPPKASCMYCNAQLVAKERNHGNNLSKILGKS
jgi:hypothetical protein